MKILYLLDYKNFNGAYKYYFDLAKKFGILLTNDSILNYNDLKRFNFDLIHSSFSNIEMVFKIKDLLKIPYVLTVHNPYLDTQKINNLIDIYQPKYSNIICLTNKCNRHFNNSALRFSNYVDTELFKSNNSLNKNNPKFVTSDTYEFKNADYVCKFIPNCYRLKNIYFKNMKDELDKFDVVIFFSKFEQFPLLLLESLSLGKIVVINRYLEISNIIEHGKNGFVFNSLRNINDIFKFDWNKISKNARQLAIKYDIKFFYDKMEKLYDSKIKEIKQ